MSTGFLRILPMDILVQLPNSDFQHDPDKVLQSLARKLAVGTGKMRDEMIEDDVARAMFGFPLHMNIASGIRAVNGRGHSTRSRMK